MYVLSLGLQGDERRRLDEDGLADGVQQTTIHRSTRLGQRTSRDKDL